MAHEIPIGVSVAELRPTQITCGLREVELKRKAWRKADDTEKAHLLRTHVVPAVTGPKGRYYIVDHHHFARALIDEKAPLVALYIIAELDHLEKDEFWTFLDNSDWCHAYDEQGRRKALSDIPKSLGDLKDDPYRSLVAELIRAGGCAKTDKPFFEFLWADFLRRRIDLALMDQDFDAALARAKDLARGADARGLPGWCGEA